STRSGPTALFKPINVAGIRNETVAYHKGERIRWRKPCIRLSRPSPPLASSRRWRLPFQLRPRSMAGVITASGAKDGADTNGVSTPGAATGGAPITGTPGTTAATATTGTRRRRNRAGWRVDEEENSHVSHEPYQTLW